MSEHVVSRTVYSFYNEVPDPTPILGDSVDRMIRLFIFSNSVQQYFYISSTKVLHVNDQLVLATASMAD